MLKPFDYVKYAIVDESESGGDGRVFARGISHVLQVNSLGNIELAIGLIAKPSECELTEPPLKAFVSNRENMVEFSFFRSGHFFYEVQDYNTGVEYQFPVPIEDIGSATLTARDKAITFMRWIRKAMQDKTLIKIK